MNSTHINEKQGDSIMTCNQSKLVSLSVKYLSTLDDYQQKAADLKKTDAANYFSDQYEILDNLFRMIKSIKEHEVTTQDRNRVRFLIKSCEKTANVEFGN